MPRIEERESIYLDMNVIVDYMNKRKAFSIENQDIYDFSLDFLIPHQKMNDLKLNFIFPYSPAHIEETANIQRNSKLEKEEAIKHITNQLNFIFELSEGYEYLPSNSAILLKKENPLECYKRVMKYYYLTIAAEENEKFKESFRDEKSYEEFHNETTPSSIHIPMYAKIQEEYKINKKKLIDLPVNEIFKDKNVLSFLNDILITSSYSIEDFPIYEQIKNNHKELESIISILLDVLEQVGYQTEGRKKSRSRMHDVTHSIYASKAKYFIIGDEKYRKKAQVIYHFIGIPTKIMSTEEFIDFDFSKNYKGKYIESHEILKEYLK